MDCLDVDSTSWVYLSDGATKSSAAKPVFHTHRLPDTLFMVPEMCTAQLCVEGIAGREDEFKATVEDLGLTGIRFELVWDSG